jgi:hypothetical protein
MTGLLWLGLALGLLLGSGLAARSMGAHRWATLVRSHLQQLELCSV